MDEPFLMERIPSAILLGIACGLVSLYFTRAMNSVENIFCLLYTSNSLDGEGKDSKSLKEHTIESGITWENVLTYSKILGERCV